jgi:hypothetical protein
METSKHSGGSRISPNAFARLIALRNDELAAAEAMLRGSDYSDFFVEGSGPPWHEAFGDSMRGDPVEFSAARMAFVDRLKADYSDFFVEGSGPPWHEAFGDSMRGDPMQFGGSPSARVRAYERLDVLSAFTRLKQASRPK